MKYIAFLTVFAIFSLLTVLPDAEAQIPQGASFWLRADTGVTYNSTVVSEWFDQSGSPKSAYQTIPINEPTYVPNGLNKLPVIRFDGKYQYLDCAPIYPVAKDYTISIVAKINDFSQTNNLVSGYGHAIFLGGNYYPIVLNDTTQPWKMATSQIPMPINQAAIITVLFKQATQTASIYINGEFAGSGIVGTNHDKQMFIGAFQEGNSLLSGDLAEIVLYPSALTDTTRKQVESYLFNKYAISPNPAPDTIYAATPRHLQFYPREDDDSATVTLSGNYPIAGYDSMYLKFYKNNILVERIAEPLIYEGGKAPFNFNERIHAELSEYTFKLYVKSAFEDRLIANRDSIVCGDVLLINGQSNAIRNNLGYTNEFFRTFGKNFSANRGDTAWAVSSTAVDFGGGTEVGSWGIRLQELLKNNYNIPTCIINGGVGGTTIEQHLPDPLNSTNLNTIYGSMLYRAEKANLASKAKVLFWYQGESDVISGYAEKFRELYNSWKADFPNIRKIYLMQVRPGCSIGFTADVRDFQRSIQAFYNDVEPVSTMGIPGHDVDSCHYAAQGYLQLGDHLFQLLARDFYGATDIIQISSPNIQQAYYTNSTHTGIAVSFMPPDTRFVLPLDTTFEGITASLKDYFYLNDIGSVVQSISTDRNRLFLTLKQASSARQLNYLPDKFYDGTTTVYEGPWLENTRGIGAFSFYHFPIVDSAHQDVADNMFNNISLDAFPNPSDGRFLLKFTLPKNQDILITISNILGKTVILKQINQAAKGEHQEIFDTKFLNLANGFYICKLQAGEKNQSATLLIRH